MRFSVLGSGSKGNSVYLESGTTGILIDAGFSGKEISRRLQSIDRDLTNISALFLTHEHGDHISGAGVISRKCSIPVYANSGTFAVAETRLGKLFAKNEFETGDTIQIGDLRVRSFRISHDTADPVGFVVSDGNFSVGYCTDTGKVSHLIGRRLADCDAIILEFNHNLQMLKNGPYPLPLQQRVRSSRGHLSNEDGAQFLTNLMGEQLQIAVLAHLSETNNTPELAKKAALDVVSDWGETVLVVAHQECATKLFSFLKDPVG